MSAVDFERHITRFEIENQCILVEDDNGKNSNLKFDGYELLVLAGGKKYLAAVRDFYVKGKFVIGISFVHEKDHMNDFFFDQSVSESKRIKIHYDPSEPKSDGRTPVNLEVYFVTKH